MTSESLPQESDSSLGPPASPFDPPDPSLRAGVADDQATVFDPDAPVMIGVSFDGPIKAQEYLLAMTRLRNDGSLSLKDAVIVTKQDDGKAAVTETMDPTPGRAAISGGMWVGLIGLFVGGPVGWLAGIGIGAGAGAVAAKVVDLGIPDEWVDWFKQTAEPGTSTVIVLADHVHVHALAEEAQRFRGAELVYTTLTPSAMERLDTAFETGA